MAGGGSFHFSDTFGGIMERDYEVRIARPVEDVFAVLAAVDKYHEWLPPSDVYVRTELVADEPIKLGAEFVDFQARGMKMPGEVHIYEPPRLIGFRQQLKMPLGKIAVRMEYTLTGDGDGTHVVRHHVFKMPLLLRVAELFLKRKIIDENERIVAALKHAVESCGVPYGSSSSHTGPRVTT